MTRPLPCEEPDFDIEPLDCERCGGEGIVSYLESHDLWGEDCPSRVDHLLACPACRGTGVRP